VAGWLDVAVVWMEEVQDEYDIKRGTRLVV
jgi:hypothetical protein